MLIDDFNQIIEDKADEIQQNVKFDLKKDIDKDKYYQINLFLELMNFKYRTLYGKSYYVICSKELKKKLSEIPNEYIRNFHKILEIISSKGNLIPYQSKHIESASFDTLFNNYGINHVHLSPKLEEDSDFMERSDYLLFFITYKNAVFLIDIDKHIHNDEWIDMVSQPWQTEEQRAKVISAADEYYSAIRHIFTQDLKEARRRPEGLWGNLARRSWGRTIKPRGALPVRVLRKMGRIMSKYMSRKTKRRLKEFLGLGW